MNKFVKIGNYLVRAEETDNIHSIYDGGRIKRVYFKPIEDGHFINTSQTIDELLEILNAKEQPVGWIPCSERLPYSQEDVLCDDDGRVTIGYYTDEEVGWHDTHSYRIYPTAWMPLPEPWKGAANEGVRRTRNNH